MNSPPQHRACLPNSSGIPFNALDPNIEWPECAFETSNKYNVINREEVEWPIFAFTTSENSNGNINNDITESSIEGESDVQPDAVLSSSKNVLQKVQNVLGGLFGFSSNNNNNDCYENNKGIDNYDDNNESTLVSKENNNVTNNGGGGGGGEYNETSNKYNREEVAWPSYAFEPGTDNSNDNDNILEEDVDFEGDNVNESTLVLKENNNVINNIEWPDYAFQSEDYEQPPKKKRKHMDRRINEIVDGELSKLLSSLDSNRLGYNANQAAYDNIMQHPEIQALPQSHYNEMTPDQRFSYWNNRVSGVLGKGGKGSAARLADSNKEGLHMLFGANTREQLLDIRSMQRGEEVVDKYGGWTAITSSPRCI